MAIPPRPPLCPHRGTTSKALNAAMYIQRRIRTLSLQPSERERQKFVKIRRIVASATVLTVWGFCWPFPRSNGACIFQASSVIPGMVLINSRRGFARDCFGSQALVISVNGGSRYRSPLGARCGWCLRFLVWPDSRGVKAASQIRSSIKPVPRGEQPLIQKLTEPLVLQSLPAHLPQRNET